MQALRNHTLLSPETTRLIQTSKPELRGSNSGFGFGMQIFGQDGSRVGHTGGGPGTAAIVELDMENDLVTVVLGNQNTGSNSVWLRAPSVVRRGESVTELVTACARVVCSRAGHSGGPRRPHRQGTNNKVRTVHRQSYGVRDNEYFELRIYALHETRYALVG